MKTRTILTLGALLLGLQWAGAQGTAFTYQGRLHDGANPANGLYDFQFQVFDAFSGGSSLGSPNPNSLMDVAVNNGLFTVVLDFGPGVFNGADRWLQVLTQKTGGGSFVAISPRQKLRPTPYAIFAGNAAQVGGQAATAFVAKAGDTMTGKLIVVGDFDVDATPLNVTFAKMVMHGGGPISFLGNANDRTLYLGRNGNPDVAVQTGTGNVGIGTTSPKTKLDVKGSISAQNLPGVLYSQANAGAGTFYQNEANVTVDSFLINVPASGFLFVSAFLHTVGERSANEDFKLMQGGTELVKTTSDGLSAQHAISWVIPVTAGLVPLQTILWRVNDNSGNFGGHYFAHNLTGVYLPVKY